MSMKTHCTTADRPAKPYPTFPLYAHGNGQWAKKIRGQTLFFGPWADPKVLLRTEPTTACKAVGSMQNRELRTEVLRSRFGDLKIVTPVVGFGTILLFQILHDDFIRYIPTAGHEVPSCPQVATPELFGDVLELHHQLSRTLAFDVLHDLAGRQVRRTGQQMS